MPNTVWLGARRLVLKPDGIEFDYAGDRVSASLEFEGPYELCLSSRPVEGSTMPGFGNLTVDRSVVRRGGAPGMGSITVYLSDETGDESETTGKPITEVYWLEQERDARLHPRYQAGGANALTRKDLFQIALWQEQSNPDKKDAWTWEERDTAGDLVSSGTLSANAQHLAAKLAIGRDSYFDYTPIATLTTYTRAKPASVRTCGKRITGKPFTACPNGYVWLRSADRHTRSGRHGKWARTQSFIGAVSWDTDFYEAET